ncbi:glycosyltransferase family 4 protein [Siccirubricoccus sp. KC 17139]|uniref:Glycosyltransferase family 4 protein n=1 Tax=Siccirubricoccus soli TaxID=2899147 RepID=A0ABT1CZ93_9PROT|nr:glycosyltransferase family 4 protein [Siccirubricoccus soli]MCO6414976.1 glycosyltransferase family 4 protein [Siccirubricoccus soli]MCP2681107.1 glycosyltransferase family 4 protein [Siccirubricoccus soli]
MRILYSHRIQSRDGMSVHLDSLVAALRAEGHEVLVVGPSAYEEAGFGGESRLTALVRRLLPRFAAELAELAYSFPAYLRLARAAHAFRPEAIYERYNLFFLSGALLARRLKLPFLVEVNAPLAEERARFGGLALGALARWTERFVWRAADRALPVTEVLAGHLRAAGVAPERILVVPNGIDLAEFPDPAPPAPKPAVTLGFVGFVREWHGLDAVVRAIAGFQGDMPLELLVVGEGPARPGLEALAAELGIADRVRFTGLAGREAIPGLVAGFDIALQPASVAYASPLKVFEYMAAGRAIVAPDQPNIREVLRDGETALLFDPAAPGAMWAAVERLARDPALRARLGAAARAEVVARDLTWAGNARRVAALFQAERERRARP